MCRCTNVHVHVCVFLETGVMYQLYVLLQTLLGVLCSYFLFIVHCK